MLTNAVDWDPRAIDHSELFSAFGDYKRDIHQIWEISSATFVCDEHHAYGMHHFNSDDFGAVLLVNDTEIVDAPNDWYAKKQGSAETAITYMVPSTWLRINK